MWSFHAADLHLLSPSLEPSVANPSGLADLLAWTANRGGQGELPESWLWAVCVWKLLSLWVVLLLQAQNILMLFAKSFFRTHADDEPPFHRGGEQRSLARYLDGTSPRPLRSNVPLTDSSPASQTCSSSSILYFSELLISHHAENLGVLCLFSLPPASFFPCVIHKIWLTLSRKTVVLTSPLHHQESSQYSSHLDFGNMRPTISLQFSEIFFLKPCTHPTKTLVTLLLKKEKECRY